MAGGVQQNTRRSNRRTKGNFDDINVTPFVDVMLVLLIVFMVAAPMMITGVEVDLPKSQAGAVKGKDEPITITLKRNGKIFLNEQAISKSKLIARLRAITKQKADNRIFIRGDSRIDYGWVMEIMGRINAAGFSEVALITDNT